MSDILVPAEAPKDYTASQHNGDCSQHERQLLLSVANSAAPVSIEVQNAVCHESPATFSVDSAGATRRAHPFAPRERWFTVVMFCLINALLFADQNLMAPNLDDIRRDFGFSEQRGDQLLGGTIAALFFCIGAPAAIAVGYLTDTVNRRNLLFAVVVVGVTPCLLTIFITRYWQLLLARMCTGLSLGGSVPLMFSLLGDLFPPSQRNAVTAVLAISGGAGTAIGQGVAGFVGGRTNWKWPFFIVAVPALLCAAVMLVTTREPPRGATEHALVEHYAQRGTEFHYDEKITWRKFRLLLRTPTNLLVILQGLPGCLPWGMLLTFLTDYLHKQRGLSKDAATSVVLTYGLGGGLGVIAGGAFGQFLYNFKKELMCILAGASVLMGVVPLYALVNMDVAHMSVAGVLAIAFVGGAIASVANPNLRPMILNVNEPETRGMAMALQATLDDVGKGLGPALVSVLITWVGGRQGAFNLAIAGWLACGCLLLATALTLRRDEERMQSRLTAALAASHAPLSSAAHDADSPVPMDVKPALGDGHETHALS